MCCEPYHPFCVGDNAAMRAYVMRTIPRRNSQPSSPKSEPNSSLSTLLSPPLTPIPFGLKKTDPGYVEDQLIRQIFTWTCLRCRICTICSQNSCNDGKKVFLNCTLCRKDYHMNCLPKKDQTNILEDEDQCQDDEDATWMCRDCLTCTSCGKKIDSLKKCQSIVNENFSAGTVVSAPSRLTVCMECMKKRQRGSFCPICQSCYDDNDYDTKVD